MSRLFRDCRVAHGAEDPAGGRVDGDRLLDRQEHVHDVFALNGVFTADSGAAMRTDGDRRLVALNAVHGDLLVVD